jgi:Transglycosylase-like domain
LKGVATHNGHVRAATKAELRRSLRILRRQTASASVSPQLEAIAQCESHGDPTAIGGGGLYRGKYQFSYSTWQSVGGHGDPAAAPEAEQDRRAAMLLARSGTGQWPVCGA